MTASSCPTRPHVARRIGDRDRGQTEYADTDADFARRVLLGSGIGAQLDFDAPAQGRFRFRFRSRRDASTELVSVESPGIRGTFDTAGRTVIACASAAGLRVTVGETATSVQAAVPVLLPSDRSFHLDVPAGMLRLVVVDAGFVRSVRRLGRTESCPDVALALEPDPVALPALRSSIQAVAAAAAEPVRTGRLSVQVRLVQAVDRAFGARRSAADPLGAAATTVRLAEAWLAAHCHEVVSLPALSTAIGISVRTVQSAFVQVRGTTPTAFLREMRLDRVRLALEAADHRETTVAEVAEAWGFRHLGRFSAVYLRSFGEYPAETLRREPGTEQ